MGGAVSVELCVLGPPAVRWNGHPVLVPAGRAPASRTSPSPRAVTIPTSPRARVTLLVVMMRLQGESDRLHVVRAGAGARGGARPVPRAAGAPGRPGELVG
ncbi:hypothetical protein GCM10009634_23590 [Saccharothrix xinjiangensis]